MRTSPEPEHQLFSYKNKAYNKHIKALRWDSNTWALSLRSYFSPRITAPYVGVRRHLLTASKSGFNRDIPASRLFR